MFGTPVGSLSDNSHQKCDLVGKPTGQKTINFWVSQKVDKGVCRLLILFWKKRLAVPNFPCF
jgi:hypothetical protein